MRPRTIIVLGALLTIPFASAQSQPPPHRPMPELIAALKNSNPPDPQIALELAQYGAPAVPELVKLADEVGYVTTGMLERIPVNPYIPQARAVIDSIADPAAIPALKLIIFDPHLGSAARKRLLALKAPYSYKEIAAIVAHDKKTHAVEDRMTDEYPRLFSALTPNETAGLLMDFLRPGQEILFFSLNNGENIHNAKPQDLQFVRDTLALLAKTGSPAAKKLLARQALRLSRTSADLRSDLASPNRSSFYTDAGRRNAEKDADIIDDLLKDYKKAIAELAQPPSRVSP